MPPSSVSFASSSASSALPSSALPPAIAASSASVPRLPRKPRSAYRVFQQEFRSNSALCTETLNELNKAAVAAASPAVGSSSSSSSSSSSLLSASSSASSSSSHRYYSVPTRVIAERWLALPEEQKTKYFEVASLDRERYEREMMAYCRTVSSISQDPLRYTCTSLPRVFLCLIPVCVCVRSSQQSMLLGGQSL